MKIKKIAVPIDLEKNTFKLVEFANYMGDQLSADVCFCHVIEPFSTGDMMLGSPSFGDFEKKRRESAEEKIANIVTDVEKQGRKCMGRVLFGDIVDEIVAFAKNEGADMIVIGTHGAKGLEKILLGSVAERVVKRAHCPCLVMNPYK